MLQGDLDYFCWGWFAFQSAKLTWLIWVCLYKVLVYYNLHFCWAYSVWVIPRDLNIQRRRLGACKPYQQNMDKSKSKGLKEAQLATAWRRWAKIKTLIQNNWNSKLARYIRTSSYFNFSMEILGSFLLQGKRPTVFGSFFAAWQASESVGDVSNIKKNSWPWREHM